MSGDGTGGDTGGGRAGGGYFGGLEAKHRRRVLLWGGVVVTVVAAALAAALLALPAEDRTPPRPPDGSGDSTRGVEPTRAVDPSGQPTTTPPPGGEGSQADPPGKPASGDGGAASREPEDFVAYRLAGSLCVAASDGGDAREVAADEGVTGFALSPDGQVLAMAGVEGVTLLDLGSEKRAQVRKGPARAVTWAADSSRLAYCVGTEPGRGEVRYVDADGSHDRKVTGGELPRISPDGDRVAFVDAAGQGAVVKVRPLGSGPALALDATAGAVDIAWAGDRAIVALVPTGHDASGALASVSVRRVGLDGKSEEIASVEPGGQAATWGLLRASRSGRTILFAEVGDDGYCRSHVVLPSGGVVDLSIRRDTYPVGVTTEGKVLFVEGNAFQGERTDLMCANADGTGRRVLVAGACW